MDAPGEYSDPWGELRCLRFPLLRPGEGGEYPRHHGPPEA